MVGSVNLRMAVRARAIDYPNAIRAPSHSLVTTLNMALLAESRHSGHKHFFIIGPMSRMAIKAVFPRRGVFPEKGISLLRMTLITFLIHCSSRDNTGTGRPVRIVAIRTAHLSLS